MNIFLKSFELSREKPLSDALFMRLRLNFCVFYILLFRCYWTTRLFCTQSFLSDVRLRFFVLFFAGPFKNEVMNSSLDW